MSPLSADDRAMNNPPPFYSLAQLVLASASPRRREMLNRLGIDIAVAPVEVDETPRAGEEPAAFAQRMAVAKASAAAEKMPGSWVLGADTVVAVGKIILGKPRDPADALDTLRQLAGTAHEVVTGVCFRCPDRGRQDAWVEVTAVTFMDAPEDVLAAYIATGEPLDKAGAYGIQGLGSFLVREIRGSCTNVIGLPMDSVVRYLLRNAVIAVRHP